MHKLIEWHTVCGHVINLDATQMHAGVITCFNDKSMGNILAQTWMNVSNVYIFCLVIPD